MRSKTGIPPRLASTRDVAGRYANSPYPQWMKALESKYQRLHTKIMQSTSVASRQGALVRTKRAEACVSRLSSRTRKTPLPTGSALQSGSDIGLGRGTPQTLAIGGEGDGDGGDEVPVDGGEEDTKGDNLVIEDTDVPLNSFRDDEPEVQLQKEDFDFRNKITVQGQEKVDQAERDIGCEIDIKIENEEVEVDKHPEVDSKAAQSLGCLRIPRNVTTSVSRTSHKTSRSCPAVIQTPRDIPPTPSVPLSTMERSRRPSRRKHLKLFSRMSSEAQHAVNETLIEMGAEGPSLKPEASFVTQETSNIAPSSYIDSKNYLTSERLSPTEVREGSFSSARSCASSSTCMSELANLRDRRTQRGSDCLFPDITPRSSLLPKSTVETISKTEELRIPGVGRYNVLTLKRERTFQITFGDFDIRYRDIISCDRQGSETPPAEIREKAIAKCSEWLQKFTPR